MKTRLLIAGAICISLTLPAHAQVMRQHSLVCDLVVNDVRVSWPPKILSDDECSAMAKDLKKQDATDAKIKCKCTVGDRA